MDYWYDKISNPKSVYSAIQNPKQKADIHVVEKPFAIHFQYLLPREEELKPYKGIVYLS